MRYSDLGPLQVSRVGLGCNNFGGRLDVVRTRRVVDAALDAGITLLDTADIYGNRSGSIVYGNHGGSELLLGEVLRGRRDRVVIATKFGGDMGEGRTGGAPGYVPLALDASLERLGTDHVDLLYYHFHDGVTPIADTVGAMAALVSAGKVRAIGVSNLSAEQLAEAAAVAEIAAVQNEYSLLARGAEQELLPECRRRGIGFVPYYPLAAGLLTGKYRAGAFAPAGARLGGAGEIDDGYEATPLVTASFGEIQRLERLAGELGHSLLELAIAALASQPGVASVIAGATTPEQAQANAAAGEWHLTAEQLALLDVG